MGDPMNRADYLEMRLKRAFWLVKEMFPDITSKDALLMAGAIVQAFENLKNTQ
jgi:hypothetical protein